MYVCMYVPFLGRSAWKVVLLWDSDKLFIMQFVGVADGRRPGCCLANAPPPGAGASGESSSNGRPEESERPNSSAACPRPPPVGAPVAPSARSSDQDRSDVLALDYATHLGPLCAADMLANLLIASKSVHHVVESRIPERRRPGGEDGARAAGSRHFTTP